MRRLACLWVPQMPLAAHLRLEPELASVPLAMVQSVGSQSVIVAASALAAEAGITVGMKVPQARALCDDLMVREVCVEVVNAAISALVDVARSVGAQTQIEGVDRVYADCRGTAAMWPSESALASALAARALRCGLVAWVGIADSKLGASIAAQEGGGVCVVPPGGTLAFLAPRALSLLNPDSSTASMLRNWGIRTIGEFVALPAGALAHRLGAVGAELLRRVRGEEDVPLPTPPVRYTFEECLGLEYPVDRIEPLLFALRRLFECVSMRLELHGLGCRAIHVVLGSEGGGRDVRSITVAAPTTDRRTLLMLVQAELESRPPSLAITSVAITCTGSRILPTQLDLFRPAGPAPAALATVLARLASLCGPDRVGVLKSVDTHRPEAVKIHPFGGMSQHAPTVSLGRATNGSIVRLAFRAFRPPVPLEVFESRNTLDYVRGSGRLGGRVVHWAGPWRVRGEWWTNDPYAREYYDIELSDGGVYRIYRDARSGSWAADGMYD